MGLCKFFDILLLCLLCYLIFSFEIPSSSDLELQGHPAPHGNRGPRPPPHHRAVMRLQRGRWPSDTQHGAAVSDIPTHHSLDPPGLTKDLDQEPI